MHSITLFFYFFIENVFHYANKYAYYYKDNLLKILLKLMFNQGYIIKKFSITPW